MKATLNQKVHCIQVRLIDIADEYGNGPYPQSFCSFSKLELMDMLTDLVIQIARDGKE